MHKNFRRLEIDWKSEFPDAHLGDDIDLMDLMQVDIGKLYLRLQADDVDQKKYGYLLMMAAGSKGELGALMAESFAERMISAANDIMDTGNTLLDDVELEMLIILRMNRDFMTWMRAVYPEVAGQQFGRTVVDLTTNGGDGLEGADGEGGGGVEGGSGFLA